MREKKIRVERLNGLLPSAFCLLPSAIGWLSAFCLLLSVTTGCAHVPGRDAPPPPSTLPDEIAAYYDYPKPRGETTVQPIRECLEFREMLVRFPLAASGFEPTEPTVEFEWFESKAPGRRAAILFNPILGGDYPLERGICRFLARHGFHVAMVHRKTLKIGPDQEVARLEMLLRQGVLRIRQVVDWMASHDRVDPQRLGSFGISMGGIAGVITAAVEPRLRAHVVALAGGGIPDVLMGSKDRLLTKPIARYLAQRHLDRRTLDRLLREQVRTDPMRLAPFVDGRRLFMIIALGDRTIGRANSLRLWRAVGRPQALFLPAGHYTSYLLLPYIRYAALRFFQRRL